MNRDCFDAAEEISHSLWLEHFSHFLCTFFAPYEDEKGPCLLIGTAMHYEYWFTMWYQTIYVHLWSYWVSTVKSRFNEWPPPAHFDALNWDFTLNCDFLMWNSILVTKFCTLNWDFTFVRDSLNRHLQITSTRWKRQQQEGGKWLWELSQNSLTVKNTGAKNCSDSFFAVLHKNGGGQFFFCMEIQPGVFSPRIRKSH